MRPNLFDFATSELSQDAVICWLLSWSDARNEREHPDLHRLGLSLVGALYRACGCAVPPSGTVKIHRQLDDVDIVAVIGDQDVLAIEDKIHSSEHSDQLARYRDALKRRYPGSKIASVYLKTGEQGQFDPASFEGWHMFRRRDVLQVLKGAGEVKSDVVRDFRDYLEQLDSAVSAFQTLPPESWTGAAWQGFFEVVKAEFSDANWDYVPNPTGGFMGLWWNWTTIPGGQLYLQLEENKLVAKVEAATEERDDRAALRDRWSKRVVSSTSSVRFERPARFGNGATMSVAVSAGPYLKTRGDGLLDLKGTLDVLRTAAREVSRIAREGTIST